MPWIQVLNKTPVEAIGRTFVPGEVAWIDPGRLIQEFRIRGIKIRYLIKAPPIPTPAEPEKPAEGAIPAVAEGNPEPEPETEPAPKKRRHKKSSEP
jgi:hypothetical protein